MGTSNSPLIVFQLFQRICHDIIRLGHDSCNSMFKKFFKRVLDHVHHVAIEKTMVRKEYQTYRYSIPHETMHIWNTTRKANLHGSSRDSWYERNASILATCQFRSDALSTTNRYLTSRAGASSSAMRKHLHVCISQTWNEWTPQQGLQSSPSQVILLGGDSLVPTVR